MPSSAAPTKPPITRSNPPQKSYRHVAIIFVILAILSGERLLAFIVRLFPSRLGLHVRERILGLLEKFLAGFTAVGRRPRALAPMLALSLLSAVLDGALYYFLFASLGSIQPPAIVLTGFALFTLTFLVPGAPGYIGSMEAFGSLDGLAAADRIFCGRKASKNGKPISAPVPRRKVLLLLL